MLPAWVDASVLRDAARDAAKTAGVLRLAFASGSRQGGGQSASGVGSSLDFKDHRHYVPGDDPRAINWQAFARTESYVLKLFEREVTPAVDLAFDTSASMGASPAKARRSLELTAYFLESARRASADVRCFFVGGTTPVRVEPGHFLAGAWPDPPESGKDDAGNPLPPRIAEIPWRSGSLRVLVSDLLFPAKDARAWLAPLRREGGRSALWMPAAREETHPDWSGPVEFEECESGMRRRDVADKGLIEAYRAAYARHFDLWRETANRAGISAFRIPAEPALVDVLKIEALPAAWVRFEG